MNAFPSEKPAREQNPTTQKFSVSIEEFRAQPGCEGYTDQEAETILYTLEQLANLILKMLAKNLLLIDNQDVITLNSQKQAA